MVLDQTGRVCRRRILLPCYLTIAGFFFEYEYLLCERFFYSLLTIFIPAQYLKINIFTQNNSSDSAVFTSFSIPRALNLVILYIPFYIPFFSVCKLNILCRKNHILSGTSIPRSHKEFAITLAVNCDKLNLRARLERFSSFNMVSS